MPEFLSYHRPFLLKAVLLLGLVYGVSGPTSKVYSQQIGNFPAVYNPSVTQIWLDAAPFFYINEKLEIATPFSYHRMVTDGSWSEFSMNGSLIYRPKKWLGIQGGISTFYTQNNVPNENDRAEIRFWQGLRFRLPVVWHIVHNQWVRLEQRYSWDTETRQRQFALRFRYDLGFLIPINHEVIRKHTYWTRIDFQLFANLDGTITEFFSSKNRLSLAFGYAPSNVFRLEFAYNLDRSRNTFDNKFRATDHIFQLRAIYRINR